MHWANFEDHVILTNNSITYYKHEKLNLQDKDYSSMVIWWKWNKQIFVRIEGDKGIL